MMFFRTRRSNKTPRYKQFLDGIEMPLLSSFLYAQYYCFFNILFFDIHTFSFLMGYANVKIYEP